MLRKIKNLKHFLVAFLAASFYGFPARRLKVIGVTGTDGKTTTVNLIHHLLSSAGKKVGMISTLGAKIDSREITTGFHVTTPDSRKVQKLLKKMVFEGIEYVVLEATSHGLDQYRLFGCYFQVGVLTNVSREHLDYHGSFENYLQAKAKLFRGVRQAVLNKDDDSYEYLASKCQSFKVPEIVTYAVKKRADLTPKIFPFKTKLAGEFNRYNCLAAIAVARIFKVSDKKIRRALLSFKPLSGRLEEIKTSKGFKVFVDFAHTPGAFKEVIPAVRQLTKGKIIHVFGCTGDRDSQKRSVMGETAAKLGDLIILTHEDTYTEAPKRIIEMIEPGVKKGGKVLDKTYWKVLDRGEAIKKAIKMAKKGDSVLITGVGHQVSLNLGGKEVPWSDQKEVKKAIGHA